MKLSAETADTPPTDPPSRFNPIRGIETPSVLSELLPPIAAFVKDKGMQVDLVSSSVAEKDPALQALMRYSRPDTTQGYTDEVELEELAQALGRAARGRRAQSSPDEATAGDEPSRALESQEWRRRESNPRKRPIDSPAAHGGRGWRLETSGGGAKNFQAAGVQLALSL